MLKCIHVALTLCLNNSLFDIMPQISATLAQSVEQRIRNASVIGSNPMGGSIVTPRSLVAGVFCSSA